MILRRLLAFALACWIAPASAQDHPAVPLVSFYAHWDHHWYVWLKGDATYEAVEVMSRGHTDAPQIWVFFTERAAPKRQHHFTNDRQLAAAFGWQFRGMTFSTAGAAGESRSLAVSLRGPDDRSVSIDIERNPAAVLSAERGGLTNQIGHSGDRLILLFFREQGALAARASVTIDGVEVAQPRPGAGFAAPFDAAYSSNIITSGFPFTTWRLSLHKSDGGWQANLANGSVVQLETVGQNALQTYRQGNGEHGLAIRFVPAIPPVERLAAGVDATFAVSLDRFAGLVEGRMRAEPTSNGAQFDWTFDTPTWLRGRAMRAQMTVEPAGDARVALRATDTKP
jgi:hypothetical protein